MSEFRAMGDNIIGKVVDKFGERKTKSGIIYNERNGEAESVRPRWFQVTHVGPRADPDVPVGAYALVKHGRWSRHFVIDEEQLHKLEPESILALSEEPPTDADVTLPGV